MPYTPAHIIFAAPIWYGSRRRLPLPPLVVGCIAPDLPYLAHLGPVHGAGHTLMGLATHSVPHGLVALSIWYLWLEKPTLTLLGLRPSKRQVSVVWCLLVILSLLFGATTHVLLDAASHESGWFVQQVGGLRHPVGGLPIFKWIQYGGGVLGLGATGWWYLKHQKIADIARPQARLSLMGASILAMSTVGFSCIANWVHQADDLRTFAVYSASGAMSGFVFGACLYAAVVYINAVFDR